MSSDEMLSTSHSPEPKADEPTIVSMAMEESPSDSRPTPAAAATTTTPTTTKATPSQQPSSKKRTASTSEPMGAAKVTKRRAARACVSCRARKVRCDVVEGAPCGNCRWDNVECIVQESRRRKKNLFDSSLSSNSNASVAHHAEPHHHHPQLKAKTAAPVNITAAPLRRQSEVSQFSSATSNDGLADGLEGHVPHLIYQRSGGVQLDPLMLAKLQASSNGSRYPSIWPNPSTPRHDSVSVSGDLRTAQFLNTLEEPDASSNLPAFIRPLPVKIGAEDVAYLHAKGALTLPSIPLQNALLRCYVEYVHPYMPLIDLNDFLTSINSRDGLCGQISLFLYHAVMFSASAFVDSKYLQDAGYSSRKAARKAFFYKSRLLYDFDYESDRLVLVQALLLMTYWYETPDDQKDTWHWMGVAISVAHTIGLHRNPANTTMPPRKKNLWKRIWWSCFMRDRMVALGMRRPTRIKDEDFDVPMLEEADFDIEPLSEEIQVLGDDCRFVRDMGMQQELALMCIEKAKLCLCISNMLKAQYSVLIRDKAKENTTNSSMMLFPNKQLNNIDNVKNCDIELVAWANALPACCQYRPLTCLDLQNGRSTVAVQRNLLHMVYYTTVSALHRPQFLPASPLHAPQTSAQVQELSRMRVRDAATQITRMVSEMHTLRLERFLPTTGVTVVLPAMIIHLLEMKSSLPQARDNALHGFRQCMTVMERLRDSYAAADYAVHFLDAALRKASIDLQLGQQQQQQQQQHHHHHQNAQQSFSPAMGGGHKMAVPPVPSFNAGVENMATPPPEPLPYDTNATAALAAQQETVAAAQSTLASRLFPQSMHHQHTTQHYVPPADIMSVGMAGGPSPPHTEKELMTPSASGASSDGRDYTLGGAGGGAPLDMDIEMDFDGMDHHDEFDWNAITGTNIDFDQWLQFPPSCDNSKGAAAAAAATTAGAGATTIAIGNNAIGSDVSKASAGVNFLRAGGRVTGLDFGASATAAAVAAAASTPTDSGPGFGVVSLAEVDGSAALMGLLDQEAAAPEGIAAPS